MKYAPLLSFAMVSLLPAVALAQDPASAPMATATATATAAPAAPFCGLGEVSGIDPAEAAVAARVVCDEVWRATGGQPAATYRVSFGKLGAKILVRLESQGNAGARDERHMELVTLEEVTVGAPRLADALVQKESLRATESATNVLGSAEKSDNQKRGLMKLEGGLLGTGVIGPALVAPAPGLYMQLAYNTGRATLASGLRFGVGSRMQHFGFNAGADYHLSDADIAPFVGGGAAWTVMGIQPEGETKLTANGFGVYAQAGVTAFRASRTNFRIGLRADIPFYALEGTRSVAVPAGTGTSYKSESVSRYGLPISLTVGVALF